MTVASPMSFLARKRDDLAYILPGRVAARVRRVVGLTVECSGMPVPVGSFCRIYPRLGRVAVDAEVIGFREGATLLMTLGEMQGVGPGDRVECLSIEQFVPVGPHLLGRVLDGRGRPIDGKGPVRSAAARRIHGDSPHPVSRPRITEPLATGVRAIDAFATIGRGQRIGIFSGTGVGKSMLLGAIARFTQADVSVIALVGERGREVREFLEKNLGPEGRARSVVVVATGDQPPTVRVKAPFVATAIAEYFRDEGLDVALLMDSVTRVAMAQRDIGGSVGEVPATKGYTPSVFALLPRLMERAGQSPGGSITGFYNVLVEGDELAEPISDAVRGVLDGHIVLARRLAQRNHYPAVDILDSISRVMVDIVPPEHEAAAARLRASLAIYREVEELINIGAYVEGANPEADMARRVIGPLNAFLQQAIDEAADYEATCRRLLELKAMAETPAAPTAAAR
ncbi:MAG: FliI/YscN family ATPase, partial [Planctomycetota bacterium]